MGTPLQFPKSDRGSRRRFWKFVPKSKTNTLKVIYRLSRYLLGSRSDILVAFKGLFLSLMYCF